MRYFPSAPQSCKIIGKKEQDENILPPEAEPGKIRPLLLLKNIDEWQQFFLVSAFPVRSATVQLVKKQNRFCLKSLRNKKSEEMETKKRIAVIIQWRDENWSLIFAEI